LSDRERGDRLGLIKVGVHRDIGITFFSRFETPSNVCSDAETAYLIELSEGEHERYSLVTQVFASAISCAYFGIANHHWEPFARMVLGAAYEATLLVAAQNFIRSNGAGCSRDVLLTFLGGGVFGNQPAWIHDAIGKAIARIQSLRLGLNMHICHFKVVDAEAAFNIDLALVNFLSMEAL
jgi:hypothetical protein